MNEMEISRPQTIVGRVSGLDSLRFLLALWVVIGHIGSFPLHFDKSNFLGKLASSLYANAFSGPAAVIVFFVISGFCIHYPFRNGRHLEVVPYFARRHIRIWIPILAAVLIGQTIGVKIGILQDSILWSLVAEEIYYVIYPVLLKVRRYLQSWSKLLIVSYILAFIVILQDPTAGNYPSYGPYLNWLLGLPCWLLGCLLAERSEAVSQSIHISVFHIWCWRFGAWFGSIICSILRFHTPVKYPWSLTIFAVLAYFWVLKEIQFYRVHKSAGIIESFGKASYSIYLVHLIGIAIFASINIESSSESLTWILGMSLTLAICSVFYWAIELPSHLLARKLAAKLSAHSSLREPSLQQKQ